ncbi:MAG: cardiolipin synthase [Desulfobulbus propionicus]|nr:MAG: cardiolipin synthase [Desulfobulbus propionicus]
MDRVYWSYTTAVVVADLAIRVGLSLRIIMRKRAASVSLAWLVVILLLPFAGAIIYLLLGEKRLGERRGRKFVEDLPVITAWLKELRQRTEVNWEHVNPECLPIARQIDATITAPAMPDNSLELIETPDAFFRSLVRDIDQATSSCYLEFYIWNQGGAADEVLQALIRACRRGVTCRVLLDSIGSRQFLHSSMTRLMRQSGIELVEALPAGIFRALFVRLDLRNHRKVITIDGRIAYTGSQNLVDPKYFRQDEGVGEWVDTMVRLRGPAVEALTASFIYDWAQETDGNLKQLLATSDIHPVEPVGNARVQIAPSGPGYGEDVIHNLLLTTIYAARHELILTTPYFVPDKAMLAALSSAAQRGVDVIIILPEKNDSKLVHYASRARFEALTAAGVKIMAYHGGLLHAKTITVDSDFCTFGSLNLDMRSFWINFEMTLFIYEKEFTCWVREMQTGYLKNCRQIRRDATQKQPFWERLKENTALLVAPLL